MNKSKTETTIERRWYKLSEVAKMFGLNHTAIYNRVQDGTIPCDKSLGLRAWRIPAAWCEDPAGYTPPSTAAKTAATTTVVQHQPGSTEVVEPKARKLKLQDKGRTS